MKSLRRSSFPLPALLRRLLRLLRHTLAMEPPRPVLVPAPVRLDRPARRPRRPGRVD